MQLPNDEVGISDILAYRDCPQQFAYGMQRHLPMPERFKLEEGETAEPADAESYATAYGTAVHDAIQVVEETQCSNEEAIDAVWPKYQHWLEPDDQARMDADLNTYRERTDTGWRLVGTEVEMKMPLFVHEGRMISFRGRVDVLYQSMENPGLFLSRDYKSSRMPKSEPDVHKDIQQWSYNALIHAFYPECEKLIQHYDQLRYGSIPTSKTEKQRKQIVAWLIRQVKAILADTTFKPTQNQWCPYCPLVLDCRVTHMTAEYWVNRLGVLAPEKKEGRKIVVQLTEEHAGFEFYVELLPKVKIAHKVMERFIEAVTGALKHMPQERREELGFTLGNPRRLDSFPPDVLSRIHAEMGSDFYHFISMSKTAVEEFYGKEAPETKLIIGMAQKREGAASIKALPAAA